MRGQKDISLPSACAALLLTLLPCGMPTTEGDRSLMTVMDEIEEKAGGDKDEALTPEQIAVINARNEALTEVLLRERRDEQ